MKVLQPRRVHVGKTLWVLAVLFLFALVVARREPVGSRHPAWSGRTMGTTYTIRLADAPMGRAALERLKAGAQAVLDEVNRQMSHYRTDSELSLFNRHAAGEPFAISEGFARVMRFALLLHERSGGVFEPTLGPVIDLWGFGPPGRAAEPPSEAALRAAMEDVGAGHLAMTDSGALIKDRPGLHLNLSAVAKGHGVDEAARWLRGRGFSNVFVEVGGEVAAFGHNPSGRKWRVGVEAPRPGGLPGEDLQAVLHLSGQAVATSGDYRNYEEDAEGRRYSHLLDPRTGRPIAHRLASVTVVASTCMEADGLATALMILGAEDGLAWIEAWPGADALFIERADGGAFELKASSGFRAATGFDPAGP